MSNETLLDQIRNERIVCPEGLHGKGWNDAIRYVLATYGGQLHAHAALLEACKEAENELVRLCEKNDQYISGLANVHYRLLAAIAAATKLERS